LLDPAACGTLLAVVDPAFAGARQPVEDDSHHEWTGLGDEQLVASVESETVDRDTADDAAVRRAWCGWIVLGG
jgi:hypothetical protein